MPCVPLRSIVTFPTSKGQIKPKADWRAVDSHKKQTNEFVLFAFLLFTANKTNSFICLFGESTSRPNCFRFYLTFSKFNTPYNSYTFSNYKYLMSC